MKTTSIRKQLVQKMILEGRKPKEIADAAKCTMGYVYNIRSEMKLGIAIAKGEGAKVLAEKTPATWKIILGAVGAGAAIYLFIIFAFSF